MKENVKLSKKTLVNTISFVINKALFICWYLLIFTRKFTRKTIFKCLKKAQRLQPIFPVQCRSTTTATKNPTTQMNR